MRFRGCLITLGVFALLTLVCCGLLVFVGVPRARDAVETGIAEGLGTQIADQLPATDLQPGTYPISMTALERELSRTVDTEGVQGITLTGVGDRIELGVEVDAEQTLTYTGRPVAQNGQLVMEDMSVNSDFLRYVLPADDLGDAIERGVNDYFAARGLQIIGIEVQGDELIVEASE